MLDQPKNKLSINVKYGLFGVRISREDWSKIRFILSKMSSKTTINKSTEKVTFEFEISESFN